MEDPDGLRVCKTDVCEPDDDDKLGEEPKVISSAVDVTQVCFNNEETYSIPVLTNFILQRPGRS
ncbi:hypothetical protein RvY_06077 [Ramazzottius varieornatus]|uniref:Uncharacterized protein n=1 Tax=Ramazzottius varieornatus TaxID=947166 RepID=A0A1D1V2S6_RAMVA|nr:hypothetical protein RvY_06077 [Ramazzottius varieornatus]